MSELVDLSPPARNLMEASLGIQDGHVVLRVNGHTLGMTADQADQMAADLRLFAIELRNGGRLT